jgi:hypothetical protein
MVASSGASLANVLRPTRQLPPRTAALSHLYGHEVRVTSTQSITVSGRGDRPLLSQGIVA